jgi:hypothetical protein
MSDDFFNQSFSSSSVKQRRKPPPPPPPPGTSTAAVGTAPSSSGSFTRIPSFPSSGSGTNQKPSTYYNSQNHKSTMLKNKRPTGDYYPTTNPTNTTATSSGNTTSGTTTNVSQFYSYTNPYANDIHNNYSNINLIPKEDDWFTKEDSAVASAAAVAPLSNASSYYNVNNTTNNNMNQNHSYNNPSTNVTKSESMELLSASMKAPNSDSSIGFTGNMTFQTSISNQNMYDSTNSINTNQYNTNNMNPTFHDYSNEPPLLEELGINIDHIKTKSLAVILPMKYAKTHIDKSIMEDSDLAGPLVYGLLLATELLLAGKISFGVIYGFGLFSSLATTLVLNLMSPSDSISIWTSVSILGYSLLPVNLLAAINIFYRVKFMGSIGVVLASFTIAWCTISSTRLIEKGCEMRQQRWLVGYPNALLYSAFVMLTIF